MALIPIYHGVLALEYLQGRGVVKSAIGGVNFKKGFCRAATTTGFGSYLPTGEGLFAFETMDQAIAHIETIEADLDRHRRAARRIAEDHFESAKVLGQMLRTLDLA